MTSCIRWDPTQLAPGAARLPTCNKKENAHPRRLGEPEETLLVSFSPCVCCAFCACVVAVCFCGPRLSFGFVFCGAFCGAFRISSHLLFFLQLSSFFWFGFVEPFVETCDHLSSFFFLFFVCFWGYTISVRRLPAVYSSSRIYSNDPVLATQLHHLSWLKV